MIGETLDRLVRRVRLGVILAVPCKLHPEILDVSSGDIHFQIARPFESSMGRALFVRGLHAFEPETVKVIAELAPACRWFFDVGANLGLMTGIAKSRNQDLYVRAFEPESRMWELFNDTVVLNNWSDVVVEQLALTDRDGVTTLYVPTGESEASTNPDFRVNATPRLCEGSTLDSYCRKHGITRIDLLKIDTESTEPQVLAGGRETIGDCKPDVICEVLKGRTEADLTSFFRTFGYRFYHITEKGLLRKDVIEGDGTYQNLNYLFSAKV